MANVTTYIDKITVPSGSDTITANLVDSVSGYTTPELFVVNATITSLDPDTGLPSGGTTDKSASEIYTAASNGLLPIILVTLPAGDNTFRMVAPLAVTGTGTDLATYAEFVYENQTDVYTLPYCTLRVRNSAFTMTYKYGYVENDKCIITVSSPLSLGSSSGEIANNTTIPISLNALGNIQTDGTLQSTDITISTGDKLVVTDSSNSDEVARASIGFDTSDTSKYLRHDGTWQTVSAGGGGTVTSIGLSDTGGLSITGSPITSSGTISIGHANSITSNTTSGLKYFTYDSYGHISSAVNKTLGRGLSDTSNVIGHAMALASSATTQAVYPITIDTYGHIESWGPAVTIPTGGTTTTAVSTTSSAGSSSAFAKADHVHNITSTTITSALGYTPYDLSNPNGYTSNTGTVTSVGLTNVSGESDFTITGSPVTTSGTITIQHANSITASTVGTSSATSGSTLAVPYVTYDKHGHITATGTHTHTISGFATEDTKVTNTLATTTKYYVTGTTTSTTNTGTQSFDTGIYATTTAGQLNATTYKVNEQVTLQWNSTDSSLDFIF